VAFPPGFLDELRSRISLSGLIGRRVKLVRRGREFAGLCPFHHEKTPSFYVVEDKSFFHCFGCGAHGDAIGFAMRAENLDFIEAIEKLAGEAGLAVPQATPQERERAQRQKTLLEATEAAAAFYEERLWAPGGVRAREYLQGRGLDPQTIRRFRLGWAPNDRQALRHALEPEFSDPLLVEAGLRRRPAEGEPSDYFRSRLMFPISDRAGRVTVEPDLTLPGHPEVFALGDMVRVGETVLPGVAPVAMQQGRYAAEVIRARLESREVGPFRYRDKGNLATIGRAAAVADIKGLRLSGFVAWLTWLFVHLWYLIGFQNRLLVVIRWTFSFVTRGRGARLINLPPGR